MKDLYTFKGKIIVKYINFDKETNTFLMNYPLVKEQDRH